ncbi:13894_t:CDS:2, partial [Gigaspora margarita]
MAKPISMDYLKQHIKINNHINAIKAFNQLANQTDLLTGFSVQADHNKLEIISKMRCVYLCAQKHLPIFAYPDIVNLMNISLKNQIELVYENEIQTLSLLFFGPKKEKLSSSFSESSSIYTEYNNPVCGTIFLHAIATVIKESVLEETRKSSAWTKMLESSKLLHFGSDSDSKMIVRNGVSAKLKKLNPFMSNCHCIAYRLALAGKDSAKNVLYFLDYEITIKEIYAYFANSHTLLDIHQELTKTINLITIKFIGYPDKNIEPILETHLRNYCIQYSVNIVPNFVKEFANTMINNLQAQFPNTALYNAMHIFDFKQVPSTMQQMSTFGEEDIAYIAEYYRVDRLENGWEFIFCTTQFITQYPNLAQVVHLALIIPVSNEHVELMNSPSLDKFDFEKEHMIYGNVVQEK